MNQPNKRVSIPRRGFLRGLGCTVALPFLESLSPLRALGSSVAAPRPPVRLAFLYVPNGVHMPHWTPPYEGALTELPAILQPLAPFKRDMLVLTGLTHDKGRANGDGPGDHARAAASWLTGSQALKSEGSQIRAGVSVDQVAASEIGHYTRLPSLEIGAEPGRQAGKCDSGYSCAYSNNISWRNEATAMTKETNPRAVFERMFGGGTDREQAESAARRLRQQRSILDFVRDDAQGLSARVSGADRHKLDEYMSAVREIEQRVERVERESQKRPAEAVDADVPEGMPATYEEHLRLLGDMLVLAFRTDTTRVASYMFANEGSNKAYPFIGVKDGHHTLSHHENDHEKQMRISEINRFHTRQLAYLLQRLASVPEGEGTLLDNCALVYGSSISDGNRHNHDDLPVAIFGRAGGTLLTGRHIRYPQEKSAMCNLFLSLLGRVGASVDRFGDSTGPLRYLEG